MYSVLLLGLCRSVLKDSFENAAPVVKHGTLRGFKYRSYVVKICFVKV